MSRIGPRAPTEIRLHGRLSVSDLLWVANTRHGPGGHWFARPVRDLGDHDHLREPSDAVEYLATHGVRIPDQAPSPSELGRLTEIREMVRSLIEPGAGWTPQVRAMLETARYGLDDDQSLRASGTGWDGFVDDLMPPLLEVVESRDRLRLCGNPMCRLLFLDSSRNRSRQWCDTAGCGNRIRVRRHRRAGRTGARTTSSAHEATARSHRSRGRGLPDRAG